ncbi:MAG: hypothetical protein EBR82_55915 [Caulobacteraceae bacterium]|nr:hypothetical protein [Caulobacteraceae bacterium]
MPVYQYEDTRNGSVIELEKAVAERDKVPRYLKRFQVPARLTLVGVGEPLDNPLGVNQTNLMKGYYRQEQKLGSRFKSQYTPDSIKRAAALRSK